MKPWIKISIGLVIVMLVAGYLLYRSLSPEHHFTQESVPVLAAPEVPVDTTQTPKPNSKLDQNKILKHQPPLESFNVLLLGIDSREKESSRSDVLLIANVNFKKNLVTLLSIPRDTRVKLTEIGYSKINHAHLLGEISGGNQSGTKASLQAVSNLCYCTIHYFLKTNFDGFTHFIDKLGGLEIELPSPVKLTYSNITLPAKKQVISGDLALQLVRERHSLPNGDAGRREHQVLLVKALAKKMVEPQIILTFPALLQEIKQDVLDTNLKESDFISLLLLYQQMPSKEIVSIRLPGKEGFAIDPLVKKNLYYWFPDLEQMRKISSLHLQ